MDIRISSDYEDMFKVLNKYKVKYLVVGAYAVIYYTEPRYTKDIDILIKTDPENAFKTYEALKEFGAPLKGISTQDFANKNNVYQIGIPPVRIDIISGIKNIDFDAAWEKRVKTKYGSQVINIVGMDELIKSKKRLSRVHDREDTEKLRRLKRGR